ncbi:MAG TPA: hypothetical protein ACQGQH_00245 [Xylella sp.]
MDRKSNVCGALLLFLAMVFGRSAMCYDVHEWHRDTCDGDVPFACF